MTELRAAWAATVKYGKACWHLSVSGGRDDYPVAVVCANRRHYDWTVWNRDRRTMAAHGRPRDRKAPPRSLEQALAEAGAALLPLLTAHARAALLKRAARHDGLGAGNAAPGADRRAT